LEHEILVDSDVNECMPIEMLDSPLITFTVLAVALEEIA